jgi:hypothetical protein
VTSDTYKRREANRGESRRSYLALCRAKSLAPETELLDMLSWGRFHGLPQSRSLRRSTPADLLDERRVLDIPEVAT